MQLLVEGGDAVLEDDDGEVADHRVARGAFDAAVGDNPREDDGVDLERAQEHLERRTVERREAGLVELVVHRAQLGDQLAAAVAQTEARRPEKGARLDDVVETERRAGGRGVHRELGREDRHVGGPARGRDARDRRDDPAESGHREPVTRVDAVRVQEIALEVEQEEGGGAPADRHDGIVCPMPRYDTAVLNGTVIMPYVGPLRCDIGVRDGRVAALADRIAPGDASDVVDARGRLVLPGAVDSHFHIGIYRDLAADATSETASALAGGVTTVLSYFRTGQHYLHKSGPYRTIFPEVVAATAGHAYTDFGYHLGIMTSEQLDEVDWLVGEQGVGSFKYYMFYKGLNLTSDSTRGSAYTMSDTYDLGHLYLLMRRVASASAGNGARGRVSLSLHCEQAELIRVFIEEVRRSGPGGLEGYHRARPPLTERLSIAEAMVLADATRCPVNLLHLSSVEALAAAAQGRREFPHLDIRLETTLHHLALTHATAHGILGKVNPPIRTEADREALWDAVVRGSIDTVVSDHACCAEADKGEDLWKALPGFGGTALLYPYLVSEGHAKRGLGLARVVELASANPARAFGLYPKKGTLAVGSDADLVVLDPDREQVVTPDALHSAQDFTPFAGMRVRGWPTHTILRGRVVFHDGRVWGRPAGEYVKRPAPHS